MIVTRSFSVNSDRYYISADALLCIASNHDLKPRLLRTMEGLDAQIFTSAISISKISEEFSPQAFADFLPIVKTLLDDLEAFSIRDIEHALELTQRHKVDRQIAFEAAVALGRSSGNVISISEKFDLIPGIKRLRIENESD